MKATKKEYTTQLVMVKDALRKSTEYIDELNGQLFELLEMAPEGVTRSKGHMETLGDLEKLYHALPTWSTIDTLVECIEAMEKEVK